MILLKRHRKNDQKTFYVKENQELNFKVVKPRGLSVHRTVVRYKPRLGIMI